PGYVGYGEGGVLTEAVRRKPYSVVLLDEVEKAHPDVHEIFFQVFDTGWMEDGEGRYIDFKNTIILLTTNVGTDLIMD
ncbi:AAA family ATPase, partial [Neisseria sp. P0009.S003]|uniref:AAA family ATPase n=1 Tax=Neisseria sp. P0009.S003 TaxID=3436710 RepID=UPI003F81A5B1